MLPAGNKEGMRQELLDAGSGCGLKPMGSEALEVLRIERGVPAYGRELTQEFNPLEANLKGYVSFNKECYIGQEVVARLKHLRQGAEAPGRAHVGARVRPSSQGGPGGRGAGVWALSPRQPRPPVRPDA